nr:immunoglobulin heavy chain junction region [Macaca mulatta]MOV50931.1 immunoglobulin heavy chain junction region [Macaca mulatta]MOV52077.1 immunoglobulin heavy chain junction region [Macaca mulatta]MOV52093.1 immunoglobulin heavy chain junction region [Macaca mulatta]MOV52340.1 immunoglobulin heavy chain junction region [Macaca mulatta]
CAQNIEVEYCNGCGFYHYGLDSW